MVCSSGYLVLQFLPHRALMSRVSTLVFPLPHHLSSDQSLRFTVTVAGILHSIESMHSATLIQCASGKASPGNVMTFHQYIVKCHEMLPTYAGGTFQSVTRPKMSRYIVDMSWYIVDTADMHCVGTRVVLLMITQDMLMYKIIYFHWSTVHGT